MEDPNERCPPDAPSGWAVLSTRPAGSAHVQQRFAFSRTSSQLFGSILLELAASQKIAEFVDTLTNAGGPDARCAAASLMNGKSMANAATVVIVLTLSSLSIMIY